MRSLPGPWATAETSRTKMALESWLYRLAIHAIGDLQARNTDNVLSVHLEDSARDPECAGQRRARTPVSSAR